MAKSPIRTRALVGAIFSFALVAAPLGLALGGTGAGAAAPHAVATSHALRPYLAEQPRTFPPPQDVLNVNTTNDTHDVNPGIGQCADSSGKCSLRAAIEAANAITQTVVINLPAGSYSLSLGSIPVTDAAGVEVSGAGAGTTSVSDPTAGDRVFAMGPGAGGAGAFFALANVAVTNTDVSSAASPGNEGAGVYEPDTNDTLTLTNASFSGDKAFQGGAVYADGQVWATGSSFSSNQVSTGTQAEGGAIYVNTGSVRITSDTFNANSATGTNAGAGAIENVNGTAAIDNSSFTSNTAVDSAGESFGGAIDVDNTTELTGDSFVDNATTSTAAATGAFSGAVENDFGLGSITNCTFIGNSATGTTGGEGQAGAFADYDSTTVTGSTFMNNTITNGDGGAVVNDGEDQVMTNDTFQDNSATGNTGPIGREGYGGGIFSEETGTYTGLTISGNTAQVAGGGLADDAEGVILNNSTVSGNTANVGAGVWDGSTVPLQAASTAIVDNRTTGAGDAGGGLFLADPVSAPHIDLNAVTVAGNVSDSGAGIALQGGSGGTPSGGGTLYNSTIAGNVNPGGVEGDCAFVGAAPPGLPLGSGGGNVVGDNSCNLKTTSDRQGAAQQGYTMAASDGGVFNFQTGFFGSMGGKTLNKPMVGIAHTPGNQGYWEVASDGGIFNFGDAKFYGSTGNIVLNAPVVGMASTPDGGGYYLVASDGGIFAFGDAQFFGSTGNIHLNKPVVGMAVTPDGRGYWLVASDGGVFAFGDAQFFGSTGNIHLNKPVVGIAASTDGAGYYFVASDGGVFNYGSAHFFGSAGNLHLNSPVVGIASAPDMHGYWSFASDGGVFNYSSGPGVGAEFFGSTGNIHLNKPVVEGDGT